MQTYSLLVALGGLAACQTMVPKRGGFTAVIDPVTNTGSCAVQASRGVGPPNADPNFCYGREIEPAVIETVTEQVMVEPEQLNGD